jgi:succinoglycan biosynthesis transport protein ExoP
MVPPIIKRFLISFEQNKWLGFLTFLASLGISSIFAIQPPPPPPAPVYRAVGQLAYREPPPIFTATGSSVQQRGRAISKDMLLSARVMEQVASKLRLAPEELIKIRDSKLKIFFPGEQAAGEQAGGKEDEKEKNNTELPQAITLEYTGADSPTNSTLILETFMEAMIDYSRWFNSSQLTNQVQALQSRLNLVQKDLTTAEEQFYKYISGEGADLLAVQDGSLFNGITSSQQQQRELKLTLQEVEGQINSLVNQLGLSPEQAYTSLALSADPILADLRSNILTTDLEIERRKRELRPEHPTMIALQKEKRVNEALLERRAQELIGVLETAQVSARLREKSSLDPNRQQLASQLLILQTQREGLRRQLDTIIDTEQQLKNQYEQFPDKQLQQAKLVQAVEFQRVVYQNILTALVDAQAAEAETVGSLTLTIPATYSPTPIYPVARLSKWLILLAGAGVGVGAGAGLILLLALLDDRLHTAQELRDALTNREVPLLGQLPKVLVSEEAQTFPILMEPESPYLAYYERFRSNIRSLGMDASRVVLMTSVVDGEGKSLSAYNLAIASAHAGKRTLLIEADLREGSKAEALDVTPDTGAMAEPLRYYAARSESICLVPTIANLYVLPSPGPQKQAAAIIESDEMRVVIKDARGRFDMVIIDAPSLSKCNDALLLEPLTDGIILVTEPGVTRTSLLNEAIDQFIEKEITVIGAVINRVEDLKPAIEAPFLTPTESTSEQETMEVAASPQVKV